MFGIQFTLTLRALESLGWVDFFFIKNWEENMWIDVFKGFRSGTN